jgi:DNA polymerase-3 subunit delta
VAARKKAGGAGGRRSAPKGGDPLAHLAEGPRPVYAIHGEERLLVDEAVEAIRAATLTGGAVDFNYDVFVGKDATATRVADAARTLPAFAPRRLVLVKDADKITADATEGLLGYLGDPSPSTVLVFVADKLDARTRFYKALQKAGEVLRLDHPSAREMPAIVKRRAKSMGAVLEEDPVRALVDAVGTDVGAVVAALEKLFLYVDPSRPRPITAADVEAVVSHVREESIFLLSDAIGGHDVASALGLLHAMIDQQRAHPLQLLGLIAGHWRKLTVARALLDDSADVSDIQGALGVPPFVAEKIVRQARRASIDALVAGLRAIAAADQHLKGGKLPPTRVMERLVLELV